MLKLVHFSDLHLETPFRWASADLARRRRLALQQTLKRIVQLALDEDAHALLCAGDLFEHDRITPDTAALLREQFARLGERPVFLAPGNHDHYGPSSVYARIPWTPNVHVFREARFLPVALADGITLWGAAHRAPSGTPNLLAEFEVAGDGVHLALFHGSERSGLPYQEDGKEPHAPFAVDDIAAAGLQHAFCGHYHTPRHERLITYPGNPEPLTFGELGARGAVVAEVDAAGVVTARTVDVASTRVHDVSVCIDGVRSGDEARARVASQLEGLAGVARVAVAGEVHPDVDFRAADLADVVHGLDALVPGQIDVRAAYDLDAIADERTVRGQFVRDVREAELDESLRRRVLVTGLRAFDGRDDLEVS